MASFPTSVKTFTTKNSGDTIQPADVNDPQDEINAIEAGYLNGTARLNSSNSTLATLSVTGGSTFAGTVTFAGAVNPASLSVSGGSTLTTLSVTGGSTFAGAVTLSTTVIADAQPRCRVFHGTTQNLTTNTETVLTFDSEDFDPQGMHSTATNPTRLTCPSTGVWLFGATCNMDAGGITAKYIRFRKNGVTAIGAAAGVHEYAGSGLGARLSHSIIDVISTATDYMEVLAFQNSAAVLTSGNASSRVDQNEFWAVKLW